MKYNITKFIVFVLSAGLLILSLLKLHYAENNSLKTNSYPIQDTQFIVGAFENGYAVNRKLLKDSLHFNMWHQYVTIDTGWNRSASDNYLAPTSQYSDLVNGILQNNKDSLLRTLMDRPTIQYIIGGQRCDYQCEKVASNDPYWFYAYNFSFENDSIEIKDITDSSRFGTYEDGKRANVKYCKKNSYNQNKVQLIDSGVIAYRELAFNGGNYWTNDNHWDWYLMPRIRIDSAYAAGTLHNSDIVCKISLIGWDKNIYKDVYLTVNNFKSQPTSEYLGNYLDTFKFYTGQENLEIPKDSLFYFTPDTIAIGSWNYQYYNDFKIYWYGKCDMWIDRVRLENEPAHKYLTLNDFDLHKKVKAEIDWAVAKSKPKIPNYFYFEECEFSHFPIISALNKQIRDSSFNKTSLVIYLNYELFKLHIPNCWNVNFSAANLKRYLYDDFGLNTIVMGSYAMQGWPMNGHPEWGEIPSLHPNTLPISSEYNTSNGILSSPASPGNYDNWLQQHLDTGKGGNQLIYIYKLMDSLSKITDMRIINCPQAHLWYSPGHKLKEPTNEEIELQTCLGIGYNAKGTIYFGYACGSNEIGSSSYAAGLVNPNNTPRHNSVYGQDKFKKVGDIANKLNKWGPYVLNFNPNETKSCIYYNSAERNDFLQSTYFNEVITSIESSNSSCKESEDNSNIETPNYRYIQATKFKLEGDNRNKYFMLLNRRCSPGDDDCSGRRFVSVKFDTTGTEFNDFNNWKIIDLYTDSTVATFDKRNGSAISLGKFKPGEGKLYKIAPVMVEGGTLVCDEEIYGADFDCNGIVYNNGNNVTIYEGTTVSFANNIYWSFSGGRFECGLANNSSIIPSDSVRLKGKNGCNWGGIILQECSLTLIQYTTFNNLSNPDNNTDKYALQFIDSRNIIVKHNYFAIMGNSGFGAISVSMETEESYNSYVYFDANKIDALKADVNAVCVSNYAAITMPVYIRDNVFTQIASNENGNAIYMNSLSGAVVSGNSVSDYSTGVYLSSTSAYLQGNIISSSKSSASGIYGVSDSYIYLEPVSNYQTSGENTITMTGESSYDIITDISYFDIYGGFNVFDNITDGIHFTGSFSGEVTSSVSAIKNCFKIGGQSSNPVSNVVWYNDPQTTVNFDFEGSTCDYNNESTLAEIIYLDGNQTDSIFRYTSGGNAGGQKDNDTKTTTGEQTVDLKSLTDTLNMNVRRKNYNTVIAVGKQILNTYPDSIKCLDVVNKLYLAALRTDTNGFVMQDMKNFFEAAIQNNPQNTSLINRIFYLIQKSKVKLHQYSSAMQGFQYIMQQFPYGFEGLVASWDYAATSLLMQSGGNKDVTELDTTKKKIEITAIKDEYDKKKFTKSDRTIIAANIETAVQTERKKQETKLKTLETKADSPTETGKKKDECKKEIKKMKTINEVVKVKKPKNVNEHIKNVSSDMKKIMKVNKSGTGSKSEDSGIPKVFNLYQNYPNPFNPTTKISFDLPKDVRVSIVIYDILGREVTKVINNEFRSAGRYITEFNASTLSSGIYFYQIRAGEFIQAKKMLLVK